VVAIAENVRTECITGFDIQLFVT